MKKKKGPEAYDDHFQAHYGDRWPSLKTSLIENEVFVARKNRFYNEEASTAVGEKHPHLSDCYQVEGKDFQGHHGDELMLPYYKMDPASVMAARALHVAPGDEVLDLCAAPGGKSLILVEGMGQDGRLLANELSPKRRFRMMSVFKRYLPQETRSQIQIKGMDGSKLGLRIKDQFDKILLDAPCSGDQDLLQKPKDLEGWTPKRTKSFGIRQYALLASAFMALKPGGRLVYSTCSVSPDENDEVINKLKKKQEGRFTIEAQKHPMGEPTENGWIVLPDRFPGGPIFFSVILKNDEPA